MPGQGGTGRWQTNQLLTHTSTFPLPDILINLSDLHCHRSPHSNLRPVPLFILPPLHNCANSEALG